MAKHLRPTDIGDIIDTINRWITEKLTWQGICEASATVIGNMPTPHTLYAHAAIKEAYEPKKNGVKDKQMNVGLPHIDRERTEDVKLLGQQSIP